MKKIYLFSIAINLFLFMQSCSISSETTFHNDKTSSVLMNVNMKEAMQMIKSMGDSSGSKSPLDFSIYPKDWQSLYDSEKSKAADKGLIYQTSEDSAKVLKKIFTKINLDKDKQMEGFSMKYDHLSNEEVKSISTLSSKEASPLSSSSDYTDWDGKRLVLDLSKLNTDQLLKDNNNLKETKVDIESTKNMLKMFKITFTNTIKFDKKIKSIVGKNDWISQKDDHTIVMNIDISKLLDENVKQKNQDSKIIVTTE